MTVKRPDIPYSADERTMLEAWLEWHRATLEKKCDGLTSEQLRERSVEPSPLTLVGLIRHMAEVERSWFQRVLGANDAPMLYAEPDNRNAAIDSVENADADADIAIWRDQCTEARRVMDGIDSLDFTGTRRNGEVVSARWVLVHMVEEYARHNGHADFLRERIDGKTGY